MVGILPERRYVSDGTIANPPGPGDDRQIDLSKTNAGKFRNNLGDYISHGRKVGGRRRGRGSTSPDGVDLKAVRKWAESNGIKVNTRGRLPADVIERYKTDGN